MKGSLRPLAELTLTHAATFAFPLAFAVICGRALGLSEYGVVAFYTALGGFLGVLVEFGSDWLGIREVGQSGSDQRRRLDVLFNVTALRALLSAGVGAAMSLALWAWKGSVDALLIAGTWAYLVGFAFDVSWYLRAVDHTRLLLGVTLAMRTGGIVALALLVTTAQDTVWALWVYAFVSLGTSALSWALLWRRGLVEGPLGLARSRIVALLRDGWSILLSNLGGALLGNGGVALLGVVSDPATVGAASLALRVKAAGQAVLMPIQQLSYVRVSRHARTDPARVRHEGRRTLALLMAVGSMLALAGAAAASHITAFVFQQDVPLAAALIVLLCLSVPVHAAANLFGIQSLVAFGRERVYAAIVGLAALLFLGLLLGVPGPLVFGWALLAAELLILLLGALTLRHVMRHAMHPITQPMTHHGTRHAEPGAGAGD